MSLFVKDYTFVLLIGASEYPSWPMMDIPNVRMNLQELDALFVDPFYCGVPADNITIVADENLENTQAAIHAFFDAADSAKATAIIYYSGHGLQSTKAMDDLYLSTRNIKETSFESYCIRTSELRKLFSECLAGRKILILDCCYAGKFSKGYLSDRQSENLSKLGDFEGTYILGAASEYERARFDPERPDVPTHFTGKFIQVVKSGTDADEEFCTLNSIYNEIRISALANKDFPKPVQISQNNIAHVPLFRNKRYADRVEEEVAQERRTAQERLKIETESRATQSHIITDKNIKFDTENDMLKPSNIKGSSHAAKNNFNNIGNEPVINQLRTDVSSWLIHAETAFRKSNSKALRNVIGIVFLLFGIYYLYARTNLQDKRVIAILLKYNYVAPAQEGIALVINQGKYGFISTEGKLIAKPQYSFAEGFSGGRAVVKVDDRFGYIDKEGNVVIPTKYREAYSFSGGLARVRNEDKYGFIDQNGDFAIPLKYDDASDFNDRRALVSVDNSYGYVAPDGREVIPLKYPSAEPFSEGLAAVRTGLLYGYIDVNGIVVIPFICISARPFSEGMAAVLVNGKRYYISRNGTQVFEPGWIYDIMGDFHNGRARVARKLNDQIEFDPETAKYGFIDTKGYNVVPLKYAHCSDFNGGLAEVNDGVVSYIDTSGNKVIDFANLSSNGYVLDSLLMLSRSTLTQFFNKKGKLMLVKKNTEVVVPKRRNSFNRDKDWNFEK